MIERYFQLGVRLKWRFPGDDTSGTKDGSIILNPRRAADPMIYDGLDGELYDMMAPNVSSLGMSKGMPIPYAWLFYSVGHTTKRLLAAGDVLTGFMSGCLVTTWTENGMRYVGHIGTVDSSQAINAGVKRAFASAMPRDTTGFNPAAAWDASEIFPKQSKFKPRPESHILALVTTGGQFFSLLLFHLGGIGSTDQWCVGGIKRVQPMNHDAVYLHLRKLGDK
jgi:hypothetical protein